MKKITVLVIVLSASLHAMEPGKKSHDTLEKQIAQAMRTAHEETSQVIPNKNDSWDLVGKVKESGAALLARIDAILTKKERVVEEQKNIAQDEELYINITPLNERDRDFMLKFYCHLLEQQAKQDTPCNE